LARTTAYRTYCAAKGVECRLTLPSSGQPKGYALRPPLMLNVRCLE
jgi:hypothetical protein